MIMLRYRALWMSAGWLACACLSAGCAALAPHAGFPVARPDALETTGPIAVVGDLQMTSWLVRKLRRRESNRDEQQRLIAELHERSNELEAMVLVGDLVFNARSRRDWTHFDTLIGPIATEIPVLPVLGNHDYHCFFVELCTQRVVPRNVRLRFPWLEPGGAYWVAFGDWALLFFDSETALAAQGDWLAELLDELERRFKGIVLFMHRPPYTDATTRGLEPALEVREQIVARLAQSSLLPLVISGHAHGYEHQVVAGVHFLVSAGGGGPRGLLGAERPNDRYTGRDCARDSAGQVLRPFNYLIISQTDARLDVEARGFCKEDRTVSTLEHFSITPSTPR